MGPAGESSGSPSDAPPPHAATAPAGEGVGSPPPSVHDQQTVTSLPGVGAPHPSGPAAPVPPGAAGPEGSQPWTNPTATPSATTPVDPFAPPVVQAPGNPFAPPGGAHHAAGGPPPGVPSNPYASPVDPHFHSHSHAHPVPGSSVPPPPIAPDGPGRLPYGYGHPGYPGYGGAGGGPGYGWPVMPMAPSNGLGTAGLVLGIIAAVGFCLWPVALACGILAVIFGAIGRGKARRGEATNPGQALAGIICGAVGIALAIAFVVVFLIVPEDFGSDDSGTGDDGFSTSLIVNG